MHFRSAFRIEVLDDPIDELLALYAIVGHPMSESNGSFVKQIMKLTSLIVSQLGDKTEAVRRLSLDGRMS